MRFGATLKITKSADSPITKTEVHKYRDYQEYVNETIHEERRQIIKIQDFDTLVQKMHIDHALSSSYGAWIEKSKDGKMYAILCWVDQN